MAQYLRGGQEFLAKPQSKLKPKQSFDRKENNRRKTIDDDKIKSLPILFEENKGQFDKSVKFLSRVNNFNLFLGLNEFTYQMNSPNCKAEKPIQQVTPCKTLSLKMEMLDANPNTVVQGLDQAVTKASYAIGNDQTKWLDDIPNYNFVQYQNIYQGINLVFRGTEQNLEYDFHVAPEVNPSLIQFKFDGAKNFRIDVGGDLIFKFKGIELRHEKPIAYQILDGEKHEVSVKYVLLGKNRVGFKIGDYDHTKELIIDPLVYASYLGSNRGGDSVNDIAVDRQGKIYTASQFRYSVTIENVEYHYNDILISKFDTTRPANEQRIWYKIVGGSQGEAPYGMDVDADGRVYVTGVTWSPDFPLNFAEQSSHPINQLGYDFTGFVFQLNSSGSISYSTYLGGNCPREYGESVVADSNQNAYVTGFTCSSNFPTHNGFQNSLQGTENAYLTKYDFFGHISYSTLLGGSGSSHGTDVFTDGNGIAYITGGTGNGIYTTIGAYSSSIGTGFAAKFDTTRTGSSSLIYSTRIPKTGAAIAADRNGNAWIAMSRQGFASADTAKVTKLNNTGSALLVEPLSFGQQIRDIVVDGQGSAYFAANIYAPLSSGGIRTKIYALRPSGEEIDSYTIDAAKNDIVYGIALGPEPNMVYIGGRTDSLNFPTTPNAYQPTSNTTSVFGQGFFAKVQLNIPHQRNPVIFVPGVMGSSIRGNWGGYDVPFWVNVNPITTPDLPSVYNLTLDVSSEYYTEGLYASDVVRTALGQPVYEPLLNAFQTMGYRPYDVSRHFAPNQGCDLSQRSADPNLNPSLFVFPYDWRQDNNLTATKLKDYVQCVQLFYPIGTNIDVVAHSMGGLVVRRYILQSQVTNTQHGLEKVITIASPLLGAPESIYKLYTGGNWNISAIAVSPRNIKFLAPHLPSMHQLFPSQIYHQFYDGIMTETGDVNGNGIPDENYSFSQIVSKLDSDFPNTTPGTVGSVFHNFPGQDNWQNDQSGIQYYHIVAEQNQPNTTIGLSIKDSVFCRNIGNTTLSSCHEGILYTPRKGFGDKTVPTISASRAVGNIYLGTPNSRLFFHRSPSASKADENKSEHTNITQINETHQLLTNLLSNEASSLLDFNSSVNTSFSTKTIDNMKDNSEQVASINEPFFVEYDSNNLPPNPDLANYSPAYYLTITGNTEVIVRDELGNIASIENGLLNNQVDGLSDYEIVGANSIMLTLSTGHTYSIEFRANNEPIAVDFVKGKGNFHPTLAVRYPDLNIPANSTVKLTISPTHAVELKYDANSDGEFETTVPPTVNISGEAAGDITPPTVSIDIAQQGSSATATITAQDAQSGVSRIWYSLDGQNFQLYTSPVMLQYTPTPIRVEAFADDAVANRSVLYSKIFTFPPIINPIVSITAPSNGAVYPVGTTVNFVGNFSNDQCNTHTAAWNFDNISQTGLINESLREVTANYTFTSAGVYLVSLTVNSGCGGTGSANMIGDLTAMVVVYDPNGGFVTGGGWIDSPLGAYTPNPNLTGRASFGFNSKYQHGANVPTGNTEFQFRVANFNFKSTNYDWLVVGGARAQYKGSGTVNNNGNYAFILTAIDGQINGGGGQDKFRIKIWDKISGVVIYDNQLGTPDGTDPTTVIGGGSIIIHRQ